MVPPDNSANEREVELLKGRIQDLEAELKIKEHDLGLFREEVAKLNVQLEKFIQQMSQELRLAHAIQKILVPTEIPTISGFEFSTKYEASPISGGDYFDIFELEDKFRFGILLSSSSGPGTSALFLSILLKMGRQMEARRGRPPNETLELMAQEMKSHIPGGETVSLFLATVNRKVFELNYCQAGDIIGLYYTHGEDRLLKLEKSGPALSSQFAPGLASHTIQLNPRDRLILCSEGVLKVKNPIGETFEEERLYKTILSQPKASPHELRNEILFQLKQFARGEEFVRDVTVVVMEVQDRVIKLAKS